MGQFGVGHCYICGRVKGLLTKSTGSRSSDWGEPGFGAAGSRYMSTKTDIQQFNFF